MVTINYYEETRRLGENDNEEGRHDAKIRDLGKLSVQTGRLRRPRIVLSNLVTL